ncbi:hypothetical protein F4821DRAFT_86539 [Hypoxylon rubiginosum]|uniref:Uncharacterized protein n=1 Tax=Hypoxylon rubiginosum TaxID=110542 RepID=A0ACC0D7Z2_9PEZI|nr:hypothetical protein F4821DRAFT_86539 [Hypoxylon rubiginosum]
MNKLSTDITMTWFAHSFQTSPMPAEFWNIVAWVSFFFKLVSLAFAVPLLSLILFDFCLWIWRLNRPLPRDTSQPKVILRRATSENGNLGTSLNGASSTTARPINPAASQRRPIYSGHADN